MLTGGEGFKGVNKTSTSFNAMEVNE